MDTMLRTELLALLDRLSPLDQRRVLAFTRTLVYAQGPVSGAEIARRMLGVSREVDTAKSPAPDEDDNGAEF